MDTQVPEYPTYLIPNYMDTQVPEYPTYLIPNYMDTQVLNTELI